MPSIIPYLSGGRTLEGVRAPSEALDSDDSLADIESCIDDPTLAPLGKHVTFRNKDRKETGGQVEMQRQVSTKEVSSDGLLMLRRRSMESDELARQLQDMMSSVSMTPSPFRDLVELDISRNRLTSLPSDLAMLQHLKILNSSSNLLASIPEVLYRLPQLQVLILNQNQLESIPSEMPVYLPNLRTLRIAGNSIRRIDADLSLWVRMRQLQLGSVFGGNLLTAIPDQVADMPALEELDLSHNQLRHLPSNMHIPTLIHLNVSDNQLGTLPPSISQCRQLRTLNVSKNHLATLPADLVQLSKLELFDVSENLLCIMPADILERMRTTTLLITGNPLTQPGHCDLSTGDPYTRVLQQMTQRAVPMTPTVLSRDRCGPFGSGCEGPSTIGSPRRRRRILADEDHDASIDHELSFRARQLNIRGSSPSSPQLILSPPPQRQLELRAPEEPQVQELEEDAETQHEADDDEEKDITEEQDSTANSYGLVHSLRELSLRTILRERLEVPLNRLPDHIAKDIDRKYRLCAACQQPFVNEWVTSVQVKSYKGHPAVVRRVRFCTTACWQTCLNKSKEVQSRSIPAVMPPPRLVPGTIDWIELAVAAAAEQESQFASHFVIPSSSSTSPTV